MTTQEQEVLKAIRTIANFFTAKEITNIAVDETPTTEKKTRGRKPKVEEETVDFGGDEEEQLELPLDEETEEETDEDEFEEETPAPKKAAAPAKKTAQTATLKDVIACLKAYPNRDRAVAIMKGFGAKRPQDLKEKDYAPLLAKLKK